MSTKDPLQSLWQSQTSQAPEIPEYRSASLNTPLARIRKNMRMEFWSTVVLLLAFLPLAWYFNEMVNRPRFLVYYVAFVLSFIGIVGFFFVRFIRLYRDLENPDLNTRESLKDLLSKFRLNEQYYKSYYVASVGPILMQLLILLDYLPFIRDLSDASFLATFGVSVVMSIGLLAGIGHWWFQEYYGKHIRKVQAVLDELEKQ